MFGCLRRLGCLVVLLLAALAYATRGYWWRPVRSAVHHATGGVDVTDTLSRWESLSPAAAERGERQVRALAAPRGPVYVSLRPGELASYAFLSLASAMPVLARDAQAAVVDDRVYLRSVVDMRDFAGALGSLGRFISRRDTLRLGGTFEVVSPGRALFHVQDVEIGRVPVPQSAVPKLLRELRRRESATGAAADALDIPIPGYIGDVRVGRGRITLYKRR